MGKEVEMGKEAKVCEQCGGRVTMSERYFGQTFNYNNNNNNNNKNKNKNKQMGGAGVGNGDLYTAYGKFIPVSFGVDTPGLEGKATGPNMSFMGPGVNIGAMTGGAHHMKNKSKKSKSKKTKKSRKSKKSRHMKKTKKSTK